MTENILLSIVQQDTISWYVKSAHVCVWSDQRTEELYEL